MGRKKRNYENVEEDIIDEPEIIEEDLSVWNNERFDHIYKIRENMLGFRRDTNLMLCEYLSVENFFDFVDFITEPYEE